MFISIFPSEESSSGDMCQSVSDAKNTREIFEYAS